MYRIILLLAVFVLSGCETNPVTGKTAPAKDQVTAADKAASVTYAPLFPVNFKDFYRYFDYFHEQGNSPKIESLFENSVTDKEALLMLFPNESARVYVQDLSLSADANYGPFTVSRKGRNYHIVTDYLKYRTDTLDGVAYVSGVGLRVRARVHSEEAGIDLSNLFALSAAASAGLVSGSLEFETIGISGPKVTPLVPIPASLSAESIAAAINAQRSIKALLYEHDKHVKVWPQIAGTVGGEPVENLLNLLKIRLQKSSVPES